MGTYDNLEAWMAKSMGPYLGAPSDTERDTVRSELTTFFSNVEGVGAAVPPSGDTTGATDTAAIQAAIDATGAVQLAAGTYYTNATITLDGNYESVFGSGLKTIISPVNDTFSVFKVDDADYFTFANFRIHQGLTGIELNEASRGTIDSVMIWDTASHGIDATANCWVVSIRGGGVFYAGGTVTPANNINYRSESSGFECNALSLHGVTISNSYGHGVAFEGGLFHCSGCTFESNGDATTDYASLYFPAENYGVTGIDISGNYFENPDGHSIRFEVFEGQAVVGVSIVANKFSPSDGTHTPVVADGITGGVRQLWLADSNVFTIKAAVALDANFDDVVRYSGIGISESRTTATGTNIRWLTRAGDVRIPDGAELTLGVQADADAANNSIFFGSDHANALCVKTGSTVTVITSS